MNLRTCIYTTFAAIVFLVSTAFGDAGGSHPSFAELWKNDEDKSQSSPEVTERFYRTLVGKPNYLDLHANLSKMTRISLVKSPWDKDEVRLQYIEKQVGCYSDQLNIMKNNGETFAAMEARIAQLLQEQQWKDGQDLYDHPEKFLNKAALCLVAAQIESTIPLDLLADEFGFCVLSLTSYIRTYKTTLPPAPRLCDYPLMFLATECSEKSVPCLKKIIRTGKEFSNPGEATHWDLVRLQALIILRKINEQEAVGEVPEFTSTLSEQGLIAFQNYLNDPVEEPLSVSNYLPLRGRGPFKRSLENTK